MKFYLILDDSNKFIGFINGDIDPKTVATESSDQIINIDIDNL